MGVPGPPVGALCSSMFNSVPLLVVVQFSNGALWIVFSSIQVCGLFSMYTATNGTSLARVFVGTACVVAVW